MKTLIVSAGVIIEQGKILVTQRKAGDPHGLLWEFPGGKLKEGEEPRHALQRELREELGIEVEVGRIFDVVFHTYPEYPLLLLAYCCRMKKGIPNPLQCHDFRWVTPQKLKDLAMPPADDPIRQRICSEPTLLSFLP
jgi:8-oxo-dGTP diphosphatase